MISLILAAAVVVTPCVDEVTVRASASVQSPRVGVIARGTQVEVKSVTKQRERLELTVDKNVPAPFRFSPEDVWLEVEIAADGGAQRGFVYGGLMCRRSLIPSERWLSLVGFSPTDGTVAVLEYAVDSYACGWGRPATLRILDPQTGATVDSLSDDCPAAELMLSRRAQVDALLRKHSISLTWEFDLLAPGSLVATAPSCTRDGRCTLRVLEQEGMPPRSADGEVKVAPGVTPTVTVVAAVQFEKRQLVFVRVQSSEDVHQFVALELAPLETWRDAVKGVHLTTKPRQWSRCMGLEGTSSTPAAKQALAKLNAELGRKMRSAYQDERFCLAGARMRDGQLVVELIAPNCVGNECPGEVCKAAREFTVVGGAVKSERRVPFDDYTCRP